MGNVILIFLWLAGFTLGVVIFIYSIIYLVSVPKSLKKISISAERIACALENKVYNNDSSDDEW